MSDDLNGNRTHEPNLRELTAELDGHKEATRLQVEALYRLIEEKDRRYTERWSSHDKEHAALAQVLTEWKAALTDRLEAMNALRDQLNDWARSFLRIDIASERFKTLEAGLSQAAATLATFTESLRVTLDSKVTQTATTLAAVTESVKATMDARIKVLETWQAANVGRSGGSAATISYIFAGLGALGALIGIIVYLASR